MNIELEFFDNVPDVLRKAIQVVSEISLYIVGIVKKLLKCELADIVELFA